MDEIDFNVLDNQIVAPSTLENTPIPSQSTPFGLLHHQNTVDVFTIRAYNLLSNGAIINSNQLQSTAASPHTTIHTPAALVSNTNMAMKVLTTDEGLLKLNDINDINENNKLANDNDNNGNNNTINNNNNSAINNNTNNNNNVNNTPDSISTFGSSNTLIHNTYHLNMQLFQKISLIYTAIISSSVVDNIIDKSSSSPKSAIELYQRFMQIIKGLELGFEVSPYAKYFHRLDEHLWQIKNDSELIGDKIWQSITTCIFTVYDPQTGKLINSNNIRVRKNALKNGSNHSSNGIDNNSNNHNNNNNPLIENGNNINSDIIINSHDTNSDHNTSNTPSSNSSNTDDKQNTTLTSNGTSTDTTIPNNTKSKKKYTRKKTTVARQTTGKKTTKNAVQKSTWKNNKNTRTSGNIADNGLLQPHQNQQESQQQMLQDSNQNKSNNRLFGQDGLFSQQLQRRLQTIFMNRDDHVNLSRSLNGYYTQPTSPGTGFDTSLDNNQQLDFNNLVSNGNQNQAFYNLNGPVFNNMTNNNINNLNSFQHSNNSNGINGTGNNLNNNSWRNKGMDLNVFDGNTVDQMLQLNSNTNVSIENCNNMPNNNMNNNNMISTRQNKIDSVTIDDFNKQMKELFEQIVQEKDQRIMQLERELQSQRQETQWLRRMLIEDIGCVRSMLQDIKKD